MAQGAGPATWERAFEVRDEVEGAPGGPTGLTKSFLWAGTLPCAQTGWGCSCRLISLSAEDAQPGSLGSVGAPRTPKRAPEGGPVLPGRLRRVPDPPGDLCDPDCPGGPGECVPLLRPLLEKQFLFLPFLFLFLPSFLTAELPNGIKERNWLFIYGYAGKYS